MGDNISISTTDDVLQEGKTFYQILFTKNKDVKPCSCYSNLYLNHTQKLSQMQHVGCEGSLTLDELCTQSLQSMPCRCPQFDALK